METPAVAEPSATEESGGVSAADKLAAVIGLTKPIADLAAGSAAEEGSEDTSAKTDASSEADAPEVDEATGEGS